MKVCVVVAAYDERENVEPLTRRLHAALSSIPGCRAEIVYVVEGSDGTREALEELSREIPRLRVLYSERPSGLGAAFRRGFAAVPRDADWVITLDADLNHQPEEIPRLLHEARTRRLDILVGSRFVRGGKVEGIPLWKRGLSGTMNVAMKYLWNLPVRDKTSGFRVYRADALRRLAYRNDDFAFLPEMLIQAQRQGFRVEEAPILFTYRVHGTSKMNIATTIRSYLALLRSRFDRWSVAAALVLAAGLAVRLAATFPLHKWGADGDSLLSGMTALRILEGRSPVFYSGVRIGALESYIHAAVFSLVGVSRTATAVAPLLANGALLVVFLLLARGLVGRKPAVVATLFLAVPSASLLFWTYQPNGYPLTVLFCASTLLLADRLARRGGGALTAVAFGLSAGLGWWNSIQTVAVLVPAALWIAWHRRRVLREVRVLVALAAGFVIGAGPWIAYNVVHPLATFRGNFAARPAAGASLLASNAHYLARYSFPELLVSTDPENGLNPPNGVQRALRIPAALIHASAALATLVLALGWLLGRGGDRRDPPPWLLLLLVAVVMAALNIVSEAGQTRGLTVRYLLPAYFLFPVALATTLARLAARWRPAAIVAGAIVLVFNLAGVYWPGTAFRERMERDRRSEEAVLRVAERAGVKVVWGEYWQAYPLNFLSAERIIGLPYQPEFDFHGYEGRLPSAPTRWMLVSRTPGELATWVSRAGETGELRDLGNRQWVFLPSPNPPREETPTEAGRRLRTEIWPPRSVP
ncbi:MAG: glycosyltransferase [Thermoanaerobaculia bacterium]